MGSLSRHFDPPRRQKIVPLRFDGRILVKSVGRLFNVRASIPRNGLRLNIERNKVHSLL